MQLKKAKSLESILNEDRNFDVKAIKLPEVEVVSDRIRKLRVEWALVRAPRRSLDCCFFC